MSTIITITGYVFGVLACLLFFNLYNHYKTEEDARLDNIPFLKPWAIRLYRWSFYAPFIWFIDDTEQEDKSLETYNNIQKANLQHVFSYRSWMTLRLVVMASAVGIAGLIYFFMTNVQYLEVILGVEMVQSPVSLDSLFLLIIIALVIALLPDLYLRFRQNKYKSLYLNDIPIIQTFIILMLKSDKPVTEVLYSLTKIETRYKDTFLLGYRKYIRNNQEGLDYLEKAFNGTAFRGTIVTLRELGMYSRKDSIVILENEKKQIIEVSNQQKRQKDLTSLVFTQALVAVPFASVLLLALIPLVYYGFDIFNGANSVNTMDFDK